MEGEAKKLDLITRAFAWANNAHLGQERAEKIPYITHCVAVEKIIHEEWQITDPELRMAALLHDTAEDTNVKLTDIEKVFGPKVAFLVEGVSQFRSKKEDPSDKSKAQQDRETVRKVFSKNPIDPRVPVLKLADRLHNMRTLGFMPVVNQVAKANETKDYAKLAESLGMYMVMRELEDLSMKYSCPGDYEKYSRKLTEDPRNDEKFIGWLKSTLGIIAVDAGIDTKVETRIISLAKLQDKMGKKLPKKINDLISFRVIVNNSESVDTNNNVYIMLRAIRQKFAQIEDQKRFDDFYFKPKDNDYSAIQLTLEFPQGSTEVAITSASKEEFNNWGVVNLIRMGDTELSRHALKLIFTETQEVKFFPPMATGLDFAYSISPEMGAMADYALIDGVKCPISTVLPNGAEVRIELKDPTKTQPDLKVFCLPVTRQHIDEQILDEEKEELELKGKNAIYEIISRRGLIDLTDLSNIDKYKANLKHLLFVLGCKNSIPDLYYKVGAGVMNPDDLKKYFDDAGITKNQLGLTSILIEGKDVPGISTLVTSEIGKLGGNIGPMENRPHESQGGTTFTLRMVVKDLSLGKEIELSKALQSDSRITKVVVV